MLAAITLFFFFKGGVRRNLIFEGVLFLVVLAVLANVAYCAAYVVDLFVQVTAFRERRRALLHRFGRPV